jgi:N-acetylmuramoyl-L-alanine amidase
MKAVMIRNSDIFVDLDMRSEKARKANADILISIHADAAANKSARGASVLVLNNDRAGRENQKMSNSESKHSLLLGGASEVLEETAANGESNEYMKNMIIDLTSGKSRDSGYDLANRIITYFSKFATLHKYRPDERSLAVLKAPDIPSILVETGFISNEREEKLLTSADHQKKIANAIFQSIRDHLRDPRYRVENCR